MTEYPPPPPGSYPPPPPGNYPPQGGFGGAPAKTNSLAIASLVCSVAGLLCGVGSIVGIILGFVAMNQIKKTGEGGHGLALAGVIVGIVLLVLGVIGSAVYLS
ncbi:MAG: DUF4190 domain-containing protein [Mycobacterium sp.]